MMFAWNPLFHIIDQCRGFVFRNYFPRNSSWEYALWVGIVLLMIGLMAEFLHAQACLAKLGCPSLSHATRSVRLIRPPFRQQFG